MCHICLQNAAEDWERYEQAQPGVVPKDTGKIVWSTSQIIEQLRTGAQVFDSVIEYSVPTNGSFYPLGEADGFSPLNGFQQQQAREAYKLWDDLIASSIVETNDPTTSDLKISNTSTNIEYAHAFPPFGGPIGGTVWLNSTNATLQNPVTGQHGFHTLIHEIGHTLGLDHAGKYNGGILNYSEHAQYAQDSYMYSIMSYFHAGETGADWVGSDGRFYYAQTPMLHDVLAIQEMYGADMTTRADDTVYGYNSNTNSPIFDFSQNDHPILTIWDAGGTDTLDLSGMWPDLFNKGSYINLTPGSFSDTASMTNNIAIAYGTWIENAIGSRGNDTLVGNQLNNRLVGGAGDDVLEGSDGDDYLDGGAGNDVMRGGAGDDILVYDAADDVSGLDGGSGTDTLLINGGILPTIDLTSHGIEFADHVQTNTDPNQFWVTQTDHYNANWQRLSQEGVDDVGFTWKTVWDVHNTSWWSSYTFNYDAQGNRYQQNGERDNGQTWSHVWDVQDTGSWSKIETAYDSSNISWWSTQAIHFNDAAQIYLRTGERDDGSTWQHQYDVDGVEGWSRFSFYFDDEGRLTKQGGAFDFGETWTQSFDVADDHAWQEITNRYKENGQRYQESGVRDNGELWSHTWDVDNTQSWSRLTKTEDASDLTWWSENTLYYNEANQVFKQTGVRDDSDTWEHTWDRNGSEVWHRQTIYRDMKDSRDWFERTQTFDQDGTLLTTTYVDDFI